MAYDLVHLDRSVRVDGAKTNGTGSGTLAVMKLFTAQDAVPAVNLIVAAAAPSTTDTFSVGSLWINITAGAVKLYIKTAASTWVVVGAQT